MAPVGIGTFGAERGYFNLVSAGAWDDRDGPVLYAGRHRPGEKAHALLRRRVGCDIEVGDRSLQKCIADRSAHEVGFLAIPDEGVCYFPQFWVDVGYSHSWC